MTTAKNQRLERERRTIVSQRRALAKETWREWRNANHLSDFYPGTDETPNLPPFVALINRPIDVNVTKDDFDRIADSLPELMDQWYAGKQAELLRIAEQPDADPSILNLATTCFVCADLEGRSECGPIFHADEWLKDHVQSCQKAHRPWDQHFKVLDFGCLRFNHNACEIVRSLVEAVGLDPHTATPKQMDDVDARFCCGLCSDGGEELSRTWRNLVNIVANVPHSTPILTLLCRRDISKINILTSTHILLASLMKMHP